MELESPLQLEPCCFACKATDKPLRTCSSCKLVTYCSRECQKNDWARHKMEDGCLAVKRARVCMIDNYEAAIRENSALLMEEANDRFGDNAFHISVYQTVSIHANAFIGSATSEWPSRDIGNYVVSFLTCGDEGADVYNEQLNQTIRLMDYIDEEYPHILQECLIRAHCHRRQGALMAPY